VLAEGNPLFSATMASRTTGTTATRNNQNNGKQNNRNDGDKGNQPDGQNGQNGQQDAERNNATATTENDLLRSLPYETLPFPSTTHMRERSMFSVSWRVGVSTCSARAWYFVCRNRGTGTTAEAGPKTGASRRAGLAPQAPNVGHLNPQVVGQVSRKSSTKASR